MYNQKNGCLIIYYIYCTFQPLYQNPYEHILLCRRSKLCSCWGTAMLTQLATPKTHSRHKIDSQNENTLNRIITHRESLHHTMISWYGKLCLCHKKHNSNQNQTLVILILLNKLHGASHLKLKQWHKWKDKVAHYLQVSFYLVNDEAVKSTKYYVILEWI